MPEASRKLALDFEFTNNCRQLVLYSDSRFARTSNRSILSVRPAVFLSLRSSDLYLPVFWTVRPQAPFITKPGGKALDVIKQWFGSYEGWEEEFKKTANALGGGSGWVIFAHNAHTGEFHNYWSWDHLHNVPMGRPLLVLDMYEHAYHMDYGAAAAKYVDAFMQNINWGEVNRRGEAVFKS